MKRILALVVILLLALFGYSRGMDGGQITVLIVILAVLAFVGNRFYQRHGLKGLARGALRLYDPTLPELVHDSTPTHLTPDALRQARIPASSASSQDAVDWMTSRLPQTEGLHPVLIHEEEGNVLPPLRLPAPSEGRQPSPAAPAQPGRYDLHLGPDAYVDVRHAFTNSLLLDPTGNVPCVLVEELAEKAVPLLVVDLAGTYGSLVSEFPLGMRLLSPEVAIPEAARARTVPLGQDERAQCHDFGHTFLQEGFQVVFEWSSYSSAIGASTVLWNVFQGMAEWEQRQMRQHGRCIPVVVLVTDAARLCPDDPRHNLHRDWPEQAEKVRKNLLFALSHTELGIFWYLATKRINGMDPQVLRLLRLWMIRQPLLAEVRGGWLTAYTGISPQDFERLPTDYTLIFDTADRIPQPVLFRQSRSSMGASNGATSFALPPLLPVSHQEATTPPFPQR